MSALSEFQDRFAGRVVARALFTDQADGSPRMLVYRNTVIKGLIDVLRANYPTVEQLVGTHWFQAVAGLHVLEYLPQEPSLALYGADFPDFLRTFEPAGSLPYLADVARLDRWWTESYFAADAPCLLPSELAALAPEALGQTRLQLHSAARLGVGEHSALTIWRCNRPPAVSPATLKVEDVDEAVLITRRRGDVQVMLLAPWEWSFMSHVQLGATLSEAALAAMALTPQADMATLIARLIGAGAFATLQQSTTTI